MSYSYSSSPNCCKKGYSIPRIIQDFFEGFANDLDLADILGVRELAKQTGLHQAITGPWRGRIRTPSTQSPSPWCSRWTHRPKSAGLFLGHGVAQQAGNDLVINDPEIAGVLGVSKIRLSGSACWQASAKPPASHWSTLSKQSSTRSRTAWSSITGWIPPEEDQKELGVVITDVRELASALIDRKLRIALQENGIRAVGKYMEDLMAIQGGVNS